MIICIYCVPNNVLSMVTPRIISNKTSPCTEQHTKVLVKTSLWKKKLGEARFFPLTHSAPWRSVLQLSECCSRSDKELAGISVTSSTSALTDLPGAAWLTSPRYQRIGRAHLSYTMLLFLLMRIPLNWTLIHTLFKVAFYVQTEPIFFQSKAASHRAILLLSLPYWATPF